MPHKNTLRTYFPGGYYHAYNRGAEKRDIFLDEFDYHHFIDLLKFYLVPQKIDKQTKITHTPYWRSRLADGELILLCYCLMPNHFHFLTKQTKEDGVTKFMRHLGNSYVSYFNKKYDRVGCLFQGKFKAANIDNENYLFHLSRYIHQNPREVGPLDIYPYSSYRNYIGKINQEWLKPYEILKSFSTTNQELSYESFVETHQLNEQIGHLTLEI